MDARSITPRRCQIGWIHRKQTVVLITDQLNGLVTARIECRISWRPPRSYTLFLTRYNSKCLLNDMYRSARIRGLDVEQLVIQRCVPGRTSCVSRRPEIAWLASEHSCDDGENPGGCELHAIAVPSSRTTSYRRCLTTDRVTLYLDNNIAPQLWHDHSYDVSYDSSGHQSLSVFGLIARLTQGTPAHNTLHCQVGLVSGRSLGRDWRRRPGRPRARWTDQLRNDTGSVPANLWRHTGHTTGPWWSDATARAGYAMTTTTTCHTTVPGVNLRVKPAALRIAIIMSDTV